MRLRSTPVGMKLFEKKEEMEAIEKIRLPQDMFVACQIVGQAVRLNWTVGVTAKNFIYSQCPGIIGLAPQDEEFYSGKMYKGVWFSTFEDAQAHQESMTVVPYGKYEAMAVSPLVSNRLTPPDICLIYATPAQMFMLTAGLLHSGYEKLEWGSVGESSCSDSWGRALATGKPSMSIPCFAERRFAGVTEDEMLIALRPADLVKAITGIEQLHRNGLRYPIPQYGVSIDVRGGLQHSYGSK